MMFINIITPCSRPENLHIISRSINIPKSNYRWIVVFDLEQCDENLIPDNCEYYFHKNQFSRVGNAQRNFAIDKVDFGYLYFNDDDTTLHQDLWNTISNMNNDFIHFKQNWKNNTLRLNGDVIELERVDSHNFIVSNNIVESSRWIIDKYAADGYFAIECYNKSKNPKYINKVLSIYNTLR